MSKKSAVVLIHHRHKLSDLIRECSLPLKVLNFPWNKLIRNMTLKTGRIFEATLTKVTVIGSVAYNHGYIYS
jgi:hypothetical protein